MTLQQKAFGIVIPLITLLSGGFSYYLYILKSANIDEVITAESKQIHSQQHHYLHMMIDERYHYELKQLLVNPDFAQAVSTQDRETLLALIAPSWGLLRKENPSVARLHVHLANGNSLLRVHLPEKYGDDIARVRPMLQQMHKQKVPISGIEMGRHGLFYRVIQPIWGKNQRYVGAVEIGLSMNYIAQALKSMMDIESLIYIEKQALSTLEQPFKPLSSVDGHVLWYSSFSENHRPPIYPSSLITDQTHLISGDGKTLFHILKLPVLEGAPEGVMVFLQDLSGEMTERNAALTSSILSYAIILLVVVLTLRMTLSPLMLKLERANRQLAEKVDEITQLSIRDPLTKIFNRGKFSAALDEQLALSRRYKQTFSLLMFDLDHFKQINDEFGHPVGDEVLIEVCRRVNHMLRQNDTFARWGGEEFMIILPQQHLAEATQVAEKIRHSIETDSPVAVCQVTISCGVTEYQKEDNEQSLTSRVDKCLYTAKHNGRNQTIAG